MVQIVRAAWLGLAITVASGAVWVLLQAAAISGLSLREARERISYWLCRPAALELRRSQDGRNAVCLRRAEG
jgi:hypothetical protein